MPLAWLLLLPVAGGAAELPPRERLGREVKLRILVDKVMQPTRDWVTEPWMVREAAQAGFNVFSPRHGFDNAEAVRQVSAWCREAGMYHLPWMRGTLIAPAGEAADGQRLVWADGTEQELYSPNADAFWEWTERSIVALAERSKTEPALLGVFLDYENYSPNSRGNCYDLSYDLGILRRFAAARGLAMPALAPAERQPWLLAQGQHDAFEAFQVAHWRERCRRLRQAVDAHNPDFWFVIYPAPGTPFMQRACYLEWATPRAPLVLADPWCYGRPARYLAEQEALDGNRAILERGLAVAREAGIHHLYSGGIDPVVTGADPEFCGKNAVMISELTAGYWVFYEGPVYDRDHPDYFRWFTVANRAIAAGDWAAQRAPRQTPEGWELDALRGAGAGARLVPPDGSGRTVEFAPFKLRGESLAFIAATAGRPVEIELRCQQLGQYTTPLAWSLREPGAKLLAEGRIGLGESGLVRFTPQRDGLYLLLASAGQCTYSYARANAPLALATGGGLRLLGVVPRLWFRVPPGLDGFTLRCRGSGAETVRLTAFAPDGEAVGSVETTAEIQEQSLLARGPAGLWSVALERAGSGVIEDHTLTLDPRLPQVVSLVPEHCFGAAPAP